MARAHSDRVQRVLESDTAHLGTYKELESQLLDGAKLQLTLTHFPARNRIVELSSMKQSTAIVLGQVYTVDVQVLSPLT